MPLHHCTVREQSEEAARKNGAETLGVPPETVTVHELGDGHYRVQSATSDRQTAVPTEQVSEASGQVSGAPATVTRHYEQHADSGSLQRRRIARCGELLIEASPPPTTLASNGVQQIPHPGVEVGPGIEPDEAGSRWTATVPVFGYLELDEHDVPRVVPAVQISDDRLRAYVELRPPGADEPPLTRDELSTALAAWNVTFGLSPQGLDAAWDEFERTGVPSGPVLVAEGVEPRPGLDAGLRLADDSAPIAGAIDGDDERIDFTERNLIHHASAGDVIGEWLPATAGFPGRAVTGVRLSAPRGRATPLKARQNVRAEELGPGRFRLIAEVDGAILTDEDGEVRVVDCLDVPGDVAYGTGNVRAKGCVIVGGNVCSQFSLTAEHDIVVLGSVEDARVESGGRLMVAQGILGGTFGHVVAGGRMKTKFAQNARITCGGDVEIESDIHSTIECNGRILADRAHGALRGGNYSALGGLRVQELGGHLESTTVVCVGAPPELARELREVVDGLRTCEAERLRIRRVLAASSRDEAQGRPPAAKRDYLEALHALVAEESDLRARLRRLEKKLPEGPPPTVVVKGIVHAGVEIHIRGARLVTASALTKAVFRYDEENLQIVVGKC